MNKSHITKKEINVTYIHTQIEKIKIEIESLEDIKEQKLEDLALFETKELPYDTIESSALIEEIHIINVAIRVEKQKLQDRLDELEKLSRRKVV